jgi:hydroxypyruvate reductase/glycerate 2-kinase
MSNDRLRADARAIWDAAVAAVRPEELVQQAVTTHPSLAEAMAAAKRIIVVGGGKAGAGMAVGLEEALGDRLDHVAGLVNVPAGAERPLKSIRVVPVRPVGTNQPTAEAVARTEEMLQLVAVTTADDVVICLLSGGGSALLPAPAEGVSLEDKQSVTRLLHQCGATIGEMNAVRKHLSRIKGGGLVRASAAGKVFGLIISDVVGDPLDVIASGPTAPDPTTFADALAVLRRYDLLDRVPQAVRSRLESGAAGELPETVKTLPGHVRNFVVFNNSLALTAAKARADALDYRVLNLGAFIEGETQAVAAAVVGVVRSVVADGEPVAVPACVLVGGETTVTLPPDHGLGGRNTEFVLAALLELERTGLRNVVVLSGGTDGEDGPTDAAGAIGDVSTLDRARKMGLDVAGFLGRHDSYHFFAATGDLLKTGLTGTNVMDVRVFLVDPR